MALEYWPIKCITFFFTLLGEQEMIFRCFEARGGGSNGRFVEDAKCDKAEKPAVRKRMCNVQPCPYE